MKKFGLPAIVTIAAGAIYYYAALPPLHIKSSAFWSFLVFLAVVWTAAYLIVSLRFRHLIKGNFREGVEIHPPKFKFTRKKRRVLLVLCALIVVGAAAVGIFSSQMFNASRFQKMLTVTESKFSQDIAEIPFSQIPVVDKETAQRLGSRKIGEVVELVSQFDVSDLYTQINYRQTPTRVSPLQYAGFLKWFANRREGIPYYVQIDMATQTTDLVKLDEGMKYSPSEYFSRDLMRHVRFRYPTKMFHEVSFEIDDDGHPYWILSCYDYTIGFLGGRDITGIVTVDAVTGNTDYYDVTDVPQWVDRVFSADLVLEQAGYWGKYQNGYWNSIISQKGVVETSRGYNYLANNDAVWLFTGITSVVSDKSNIGFILVNMRTKESRLYSINGAEEYSAMESAEGKIQEKGYVATFPILINLANQPTYFISLKDDAGLVKAYSFVSVANYQIVGVGDTLQQAQSEYIRLLNADVESPVSESTEISGKIARINTAVRDGNSVYYLRLEGTDQIFTASIMVSDLLPTLEAGDTVRIAFTAGQTTTAVKSITLLGTSPAASLPASSAPDTQTPSQPEAGEANSAAG